MIALEPYLHLFPTIRQTPGNAVWMTYDAEADVLYINFRKPSVADNSELTDDEVIIRYEGDAIVGYTVLHASQREIAQQP